MFTENEKAKTRFRSTPLKDAKINRVCIFEPESESKVDDVSENKSNTEKQGEAPIYNVKVCNNIKKDKKPGKVTKIPNFSGQGGGEMNIRQKQLKVQKTAPRPWSS